MASKETILDLIEKSESFIFVATMPDGSLSHMSCGPISAVLGLVEGARQMIGQDFVTMFRQAEMKSGKIRDALMKPVGPPPSFL